MTNLIGARIKALREERQLSQDDLARLNAACRPRKCALASRRWTKHRASMRIRLVCKGRRR